MTPPSQPTRWTTCGDSTVGRDADPVGDHDHQLDRRALRAVAARVRVHDRHQRVGPCDRVRPQAARAPRNVGGRFRRRRRFRGSVAHPPQHVVDHRHHRGDLVWRVHELELVLATGQLAGADVAAKLIGIRHAIALGARELGARDRELRAGLLLGAQQQRSLGLRLRHARDRANLRIGHPPQPERVVDQWQLAEPARHPDLFARSDEVEPDAPAEPVRARLRVLQAPATGGIEHADHGQEPVGRGVEVRRALRDLLAHLVELCTSHHIQCSHADMTSEFICAVRLGLLRWVI
ncbi:MAG: hypothetical protein NT062_23290 [Proteobacteria bacterium]|nr:hypothetical protein [Pseudomonadota bacterium]